MYRRYPGDLVALADQVPLRRFRVEVEGHGLTELHSSHDTLDEAVGEICRVLEAGARLAGGIGFVVVDDHTGEVHDTSAALAAG